MSRAFLTTGLLLTAVAPLTWLLISGTPTMADNTETRPLVHNVYFTLKDGTPENIRHLTAECHKYLAGHDGELYFAAGPVVEELSRPVNQKDFHVCLCVAFRDKAAHDVYQTHPRHLEFIAQNKETWASVRVFDSWGR